MKDEQGRMEGPVFRQDCCRVLPATCSFYRREIIMKRRLLLALSVSVMLAFPACAQETEIVQTEEEAQQAASLVMEEETIGAVLDALGDETLRSTRQFFQDGGVIEEGYQGDAGSGLQKMLVGFGRGISIDGAVGAKTMEALHQVQESFGLEATGSVDLNTYDTLLPLLLLTKGEGDTDIDLAGFYDAAGGPGYYDYLKGCALLAGEKYYSAMEAFENSSYGDSQERAASCAQELPESGEIWRNPDIPGSDASLTFKVNSGDESKGMCFQMYNLEDQLVAVLFGRGSGSAITYVPVGTYHIKDGVGYDWYGVNETFGPYGYYEYLTFSEDPATRFDAYLDYGQYTLEINVSQIEEGATSVGSSSVGWNDSVPEF